MKRKYGFLVLAAVFGAALLAVTLDAQGQPPPGGRGLGMGRGMGPGSGAMLLPLLNNEKVQKELELVDDQKTKLNELANEQRTAMRELFSSMQDLSPEERQTKMQEAMKENQDKLQKKLADILLPNQLARLKEIQLQAEGPMALANPDVTKALNVTSDQQDKIKAALADAQTKVREAMSGVRDLSPEERRAKMTEMRDQMQKMRNDLNAKLLEILTQDQRDQFTKMQGAKLDIDFSTLMRPGGGRGGPGGPPPGGPPPEGPPPGGPPPGGPSG